MNQTTKEVNMKNRRILLVSILSLVAFSSPSFAQDPWTFAGGPWFASVCRDLSIGYIDNAPIMYVADSTEQSLLKSTNAGETWIHLTAVEKPYSVACVETEPDIVYSGVPVNNPFRVEIWKSTDGGDSWTPVFEIGNRIPNKLAISPHDPNVVYLGVSRRLSSDDALYYTTDGGLNWNQATERGFPPGVNVTDIVFDPTSDQFIFASVDDGAPENIGVWKTVDGGQQWALAREGLTDPRITALGINPAEPQVLYAGAYERISKSTDRGENWSSTNFSQPSVWVRSLQTNPENPTFVFAALGDIYWYPPAKAGILKSTDGGTNWFSSDSGVLDDNVLSLRIDKFRPERVFAGTKSAFYRSDDNGANWVEKTRGIELANVGSIVSVNGRLVTNSSSVGTFHLSTDGGADWITTRGFDGNHTAQYWQSLTFNKMQPQYMFATRVFRGVLFQHMFYRSNDAGQSWERVEERINGYVSRIVSDQNNPAVVYTTQEHPAVPVALRHSTDYGTSWQTLINDALARAFVIDPQSPVANGMSQMLYIGLSNLTLQKTTNAGGTWQQLNFPAYFVNTLAIDPSNSAIIYAGTDGHGAYKSADGGATWTTINNGLTGTYVLEFAVDEHAPSILFASSADEMGNKYIHVTYDGGSSWTDITGQMGNRDFNHIVIEYTNAGHNLLLATDQGVYRYLHNTWAGTITQNTTWSGAVYVIGDVTISSGVTLTVAPGTIVKFYPSAQLIADGVLNAVGNATSHVTFTSRDQAELSWRGIRLNGSRTGDRIEYADITVGLYVNHNSGASITYCLITGAKIGIHLYDYPGPLPLLPTTIRNNEIQQSRIVGISVDKEVSNVLIQDNTLTGNFNDDVGMQFIYASPLDVLRNRITNFGKHGVQCISASPSFIDGTEEGGRSCFVSNAIGVYGEASANFVLGIAYDDGTYSGNNTIAYNEEFEIVLRDKCTVYSQTNYHGDRNYDIDDGSVLITDPELGEDPNRCLDQGNRPLVITAGNQLKKTDPPMLSGFVRNPLVKQAIRLRLRRDHLAAIGVLKGLVAAQGTDTALVHWALRELLANYQMVPNPSGSNILSGYLRGLLLTQSNAEIRRAIRDVLSGSSRHERQIAATLAALDTCIQSYPNTSSELLALYSKISLALNVLNDRTLAQSAFQTLQTQYPEHSLTHIADVLVNNGSQLRPTGKSTVAAANTSSSEKPLSYALEQNYPNPFNPETRIHFELPEHNAVVLVVYDLLGREVATLVNDFKKAGKYDVTFTATNLASGVYFYRLQAGTFHSVKKLLLLR
jgi:photosystem II stability/assembly factor-like uncharacterized protein